MSAVKQAAIDTCVVEFPESRYLHDDVLPLEIMFGRECMGAVSGEISVASASLAIKRYPEQTAHILLAVIHDMADSNQTAKDFARDLRDLALQAALAIAGELEMDMVN